MPTPKTEIRRDKRDISPKVLHPSVAAAVATLVSALDGQVVDKTTLILAAVTVAVFLIGYFTKDKVAI